MPRNIVVGYDDTRSSEIAAEQALALAAETGGRIYLTHVTTVSDADLGVEVAGGEPDIADRALAPEPRGEDGEEQAPEEETVLRVEPIQRRCQELHVVCEEERLLGPHVGSRLLRRSWTAELLVIGRGSERRPTEVGATTSFLLSELVTPTMVCARQYVEVRNVLVPYKLSVAGGRALTFAARLCETLNSSLHVQVCEPRRLEADEAVAGVTRHLRAYHVESSVAVSPAPPHEVVHSVAVEREASLIIIPGAHKRYYVFPWQRNQTLGRALDVPGTVVLAYP